MGYDVHITRKKRWSDDGPDISDTDWQSYVASDPDMRIAGVAQATTPKGETIRYQNALLAEWHGHSSRHPVWFDFRSGGVVVKNPDEETISKMCRVATSLRARVQGDDGEFYDSPVSGPKVWHRYAPWIVGIGIVVWVIRRRLATARREVKNAERL